MTRADLQAAILSYLHRATLRTPVTGFDAVDSWIAFGEGDINLDLRARLMIRRTGQVADGQYVPLPCDYLEMEDLRLSTGRQLVYRDRQSIGDLRQAQTGPPPLGAPLTLELPSGPLY